MFQMITGIKKGIRRLHVIQFTIRHYCMLWAAHLHSILKVNTLMKRFLQISKATETREKQAKRD